jgi:hypothetical protein
MPMPILLPSIMPEEEKSIDGTPGILDPQFDLKLHNGHWTSSQIARLGVLRKLVPSVDRRR